MCLRALGTNPLCAKSVRGKEVYMIITIARQCGCMGDQIGKALAEKYFIPFYDKDAVCRLAKEKGLYEKYPYFYGEMPLDMMLYADTMAAVVSLELFLSLPVPGVTLEGLVVAL